MKERETKQEKIFSLKPKKKKEKQSNLQEKTIPIKQKKKKQSNL